MRVAPRRRVKEEVADEQDSTQYRPAGRSALRVRPAGRRVARGLASRAERREAEEGLRQPLARPVQRRGRRARQRRQDDLCLGPHGARRRSQDAGGRRLRERREDARSRGREARRRREAQYLHRQLHAGGSRRLRRRQAEIISDGRHAREHDGGRAVADLASEPHRGRGGGDGQRVEARMARRNVVRKTLALGVCLTAVLCAQQTVRAQKGAQNGEWRTYGGDAGHTKYAPLDQINKSNVTKLKIAWRWLSIDEELKEKAKAANSPNVQYLSINTYLNETTPLMVHGV